LGVLQKAIYNLQKCKTDKTSYVELSEARTDLTNKLVALEIAWERVIATLSHRPHPTKKYLHLAALEKLEGELPSLFPRVDYSKLAEKLAVEILSLKASLGSK
jgi:hypothetical protein